MVGELQFLEAQLGLPHQLVVVRILRQPGGVPGRLTRVGKKRTGGVFYPGIARPWAGAANHPQRPGTQKSQHRQTGQRIASRGPGAVSPSPCGCTRFLLSPINHVVLPL